jgi:hypothetical protein
LDEILKILFGVSLVVPSIVQSYGLDTRLVWIPILFYAFWILIITYYKPNRVFSDYPERAIIEKIRGWQYVFSLAITLSMNWLLLTVIPKTIFTFFAGTITVAFLLVLVVKFLPQALFRREVTFMSKYQETKIYLILQESGAASIQFSLSVLILNLEFIASTEFAIVNIIITLLFAGALFFRALSNEKKSSRLASDFAIELKNSNWYKKYSYDQRRKKRKNK